MRANLKLPAPNVPFVLPNGSVNPIWYEKLKTLEAFMALMTYVEFPSLPATSHPVSPVTPPAQTIIIANGQVLRWNSTYMQFLPAT
jgi:hypothetical protein